MITKLKSKIKIEFKQSKLWRYYELIPVKFSKRIKFNYMYNQVYLFKCTFKSVEDL